VYKQGGLEKMAGKDGAWFGLRLVCRQFAAGWCLVVNTDTRGKWRQPDTNQRFTDDKPDA